MEFFCSSKEKEKEKAKKKNIVKYKLYCIPSSLSCQDSMNRNPQFTLYKSTSDLLELRDWFYNTEPQDRRQEAIARVTAWHTRGHLPHSIESTSLLTSILLSDEANIIEDSAVLQLSYNMAIIKFVNGLLDPFQQSNFAIPLHTLANFLQLPSYFVEIRHCGTHEFLPSLEMLRVVSKNLLSWLYDHYWLEIDKLNTKVEHDEVLDEEEFLKTKIQVKGHFKSYKKVRKLNLNKFFKYGDTTELGSLYWGSMNALKNIYENNDGQFIDILISNNILILDRELNDSKTNGIRLLYRPFFEEFGVEFALKFLKKLISLQNRGVSAKGFGSINEMVQSISWCQYLLSNEITFTGDKKLVSEETIDKVINIIKLENNKTNISLLMLLLSKNEFKRDEISNIISLMEKFQIDDSLNGIIKQLENTSVKREATSDITADLENLKKRIKLSKKAATKKKENIVLWQLKRDWEPVAFGVCL